MKKHVACLYTVFLVLHTVWTMIMATAIAYIDGSNRFTYKHFLIKSYTLYLIYVKICLYAGLVLVVIITCCRRQNYSAIIVWSIVDILITSALLAAYLWTFNKNYVSYETASLTISCTVNGVIISVDLMCIILAVYYTKQQNYRKKEDNYLAPQSDIRRTERLSIEADDLDEIRCNHNTSRHATGLQQNNNNTDPPFIHSPNSLPYINTSSKIEVPESTYSTIYQNQNGLSTNENHLKYNEPSMLSLKQSSRDTYEKHNILVEGKSQQPCNPSEVEYIDNETIFNNHHVRIVESQNNEHIARMSSVDGDIISNRVATNSAESNEICTGIVNILPAVGLLHTRDD